jgi:hypothetical protein
MTQFLIDIASYQHQPENDKPLDLAAARSKGVTLVNIKTTQGVHYTFTPGKIYADQARALNMGICTFHYLTGSASGASQADYAWRQILSLGGPQGIAHECDCEKDATEAIYRDYVTAMQDKLQRHILTYSGDWWWKERGWHGADLTPYYTAAPNDGYPGVYPGDDSPMWRAGYGGWGDMAMMQYAVSPLAGAGGGKLSKSAIRDPAVWAALTGGSLTGGSTMLERCKFGETSDPVGDLQTAMVARGAKIGDKPYGPTEIDRNWGKRTSAALASLIGSDGTTVTFQDGTTLPARNSFGVAELLALIDLGKAAGAPSTLKDHTHTFDPAAGVSGPAVEIK